MPTYTILYAEDVPHYGYHDIEADSDEEALRKALCIEADEFDKAISDADHSNTVCKRIVYIERDNGEQIGNDLPLDDFHLRHGGEPDRLRCEAAENMLEALRHIQRICEPGIDQSDDDLEAALSGIKDIAARAIAKAEGRGS